MKMNWQSLLASKRLGDKASTTSSERTDFERDFDRIIFSNAFRRLQNKTQVIPLPESDFVHTRLTHSLEVASLGRSLGKRVAKEIISQNPEIQHFNDFDFGAIVASACLAHDIGNPPFGHAGEDAIREFFVNGNGKKFENVFTEKEFRDLTLFEGNANGFRILTNSQENIRLTSATLAAFTKYPCESAFANKKTEDTAKKKFGFFQAEKLFFKQIAETTNLIKHENFCYARHPFAFLMEAADDICYGIIDFEDGYKLKQISFETAEKHLKELANKRFSKIRYKEIPNKRDKLAYLRALSIAQLVDEAATVFLENEEKILEAKFPESLLKSTPSFALMKEILDISIEKIYTFPPAVEIEAAGYKVLAGLLDVFTNAVISPESNYSKQIRALIPDYYEFEEKTDYEKVLTVLDYVAGMSDSFAVALYRKINGISLPGTLW